MAEYITKQDLINAHIDATTLEQAVNGEAETKVTSRLGRQYWTLATLDALIASGLLKIDDLQNAIDIAAAAGAGASGWTAQLIADASGRSQQSKNSDYIQLKDYESLKVGDDWTNAIIQADQDAVTQKKAVQVAGGTYNYSNNITLNANWFGSGMDCTRFRKTAPATITMLKGTIRDLTISADSIIAGDTTDGLVADGLDRKYIENVLTEKHGGDGFVYKRGNLSRFYLRSRANGGRGVTFANDTTSGDNKACDVWFECTGNKKSGFYMEQHASNTVYNSGQNRGFIIAQNNGSDGTVDDNYNAVLSGNYNDFQLYTEYVGGVWHRSNLRGSRIFYSNMSHALFRDDTTGSSNIVSMIPSAGGTRTTLAEQFNELLIWKQVYSGRLRINHTSNVNFEISADLSSVQQTLTIADNITLKPATGNYAKRLQGGGTLTFGSITAKSSVERTLSVPRAVTSLQTAVIANPAGDIGANLMWNCYVSSFDEIANTTTVTIRVTNQTDAAIAANTLAWRVQVIT